MSFTLEEKEPFAVAVKRITVEQLDLILSHLSERSGDINESVHAARQSLKRIRALLALSRCELGGKVFEREWACYRSAGRLLAEGRDAAVVVETFESLVQRFSYEITPDAFASEHHFLEERRNRRLKEMVEDEGALGKACDMLTAARERVAKWPLKRKGFKALEEGVSRSYRAGREGLRSVVRNPSPTNFHEWRRPVKLLLHQLQILTPVWPVVLHAHCQELHALSDRLNENHDVDGLRHAALWSQFDTQSPNYVMLASLVDRRCRQLEAEALPLGERLYAERSRHFVDRIESYLRTWRHGSRDPAPTSITSENVLPARPDHLSGTEGVLGSIESMSVNG